MEATLEAVRRDRFGKNEAGRLRREGQIPAVLYGEAVKPSRWPSIRRPCCGFFTPDAASTR